MYKKIYLTFFNRISCYAN